MILKEYIDLKRPYSKMEILLPEKIYFIQILIV